MTNPGQTVSGPPRCLKRSDIGETISKPWEPDRLHGTCGLEDGFRQNDRILVDRGGSKEQGEGAIFLDKGM